jgi:hypothetical protein
MVDLVLAGGELGGLEDRGGPPAGAVGDLRAVGPRRRPADVLRRHHHHHRLPPQLRHLHNRKSTRPVTPRIESEQKTRKLCFFPMTKKQKTAGRA